VGGSATLPKMVPQPALPATPDVRFGNSAAISLPIALVGSLERPRVKRSAKYPSGADTAEATAAFPGASVSAQSAYQEKVMAAVEAARRGEATTKQKALLDMVEAGDVRKAKAISDQISGASQGYQVTQAAKTAAARDITDRRGQDLHLKAAQLTSASADVRADKAEKAQKLAELRSLATSFQALIKEPIDDLAKPEEREAAKRDKAIYRQDYEAVLAAIAKMSGDVNLQSGKATAPTMDANRASQFKVIR